MKYGIFGKPPIENDVSSKTYFSVVIKYWHHLSDSRIEQNLFCNFEIAKTTFVLLQV